ncbi:MAG: sulfite exporter TauE/SafE family protein [Chloroflexota bacterium]
MLLVFVTVFLGVFSQTVSGFGLGLIAMPVLSGALGLGVARPMMALVGVSMQLAMMVRNRRALSFRTIGVMSLLGIGGIPVGVWLGDAVWLSEQVLLTGLGLLTVFYALYALFSPTVPELKDDRAMGPFAFISGIFSGAYNVGGPPIMIYADARRWNSDQIRSNMQAFFMFKAAVLIVAHMFSGNYTREVMTSFMWGVPAIILGLLAGFAMYPYISEHRFRQAVQVLLVIVGGKMLFDLYIGPLLAAS